MGDEPREVEFVEAHGHEEGLLGFSHWDFFVVLLCGEGGFFGGP